MVDAWSKKTDIIRQFQDNRPQYEQLCGEISYILKKRLDEQGIEYSSVSSRAKTLKSFLEKLQRKEYADPFTQITDYAAARVVFLYVSDRPDIEKMIEAEFEVIEKLDKGEAQEADRFGYKALHYLVHLGPKSSGARYDDLKHLTCEIQVRTVLQDAWAILDHHLQYKQEGSIPERLKRKINALAGSFENLDDSYEYIRDQRTAYQNEIHAARSNPNEFLSQEINLDTLMEYVLYRFSSVERSDVQSQSEHYEIIVRDLKRNGYHTLKDVDDLLRRTERALIKFAVTMGRKVENIEEVGAAAFLYLYAALYLENPEKTSMAWAQEFLDAMNSSKDLLLPRPK